MGITQNLEMQTPKYEVTPSPVSPSSFLPRILLVTFIAFDHVPKGTVAFEGSPVLLNESCTAGSQARCI